MGAIILSECKWHEMHQKMLEQVRIVNNSSNPEEERKRARIRFEFWHDQRNAIGICNCNNNKRGK
jgi:hypothetical protein